MATTYFGFDQLSGGDAAGYISINALLTDIDSILNTRFGGVINTTNYSALAAGDAGKIITWSGTAFTTALINNTNISSTAAIAYSKLNLTGSIVNADLAGSISPSKITGTAVTAADTGTVTSTMIADGTIVNADINSSAGIAKTKISGTAITAADTGTVTATILASNLDLSAKTVTLPNGIMIDGAVVTPATDDSAKVATTAFVQDALANAATGGVQVTTSGIANDAVTSAKILDGTIVNGDINASAGIAYSKLNLTGSIVNGDLATDAVTGPKILNQQISYDKLANNAKIYTAIGVSTGTLNTTTHGSMNTSNMPLVTATTAAAYTLPSAPTAGVTISIISDTTSSVTVEADSGVTINGSGPGTVFTLAGRYSVVTLIALTANTWAITGDYY